MVKKLLFGLIFVLCVNLVSAAYYVKNPVECPTTHPSFPGQSCSPVDICGNIGEIAQCYNTSLITIPISYNASYQTNVVTGLGAGYVLDCFAPTTCVDAWYCSVNSTCEERNRITTCNSTNITECGSCKAGWNDCDGDGLICEIQDGASCSVGELNGTYQGCSGGSGNCVVTPMHHITGQPAKYSSDMPNLWSVQYGNGYLMNLTNANTNKTLAVNNSGCIIFPDNSSQCNASSGNMFGEGSENYVARWITNTTLGTGVIIDNGSKVSIIGDEGLFINNTIINVSDSYGYAVNYYNNSAWHLDLNGSGGNSQNYITDDGLTYFAGYTTPSGIFYAADDSMYWYDGSTGFAVDDTGVYIDNLSVFLSPEYHGELLSLELYDNGTTGMDSESSLIRFWSNYLYYNCQGFPDPCYWEDRAIKSDLFGRGGSFVVNVSLGHSSISSEMTFSVYGILTAPRFITTDGHFYVSDAGLYWGDGTTNALYATSWGGIEMYGATFVYDNLTVGGTSDMVQLVVKASEGQTNNLQEWRNSSDDTIAYVDASGNIYEGTGRVCTAENGLCNNIGINTIQSLSPSYLNVENGTTSNISINLTGFDNRYLQGLGAVGYIPLWNETTMLNSSVIFQNGTNVGIGTTMPMSKLDINGNMTVGNSTGTTQFENDGSMIAFGSARKYKFREITENDIYGRDLTIGGESYLAAVTAIMSPYRYKGYSATAVGGAVGYASVFQFLMPSDYVSNSSFYLKMYLMKVDANSGNTKWGLSYRYTCNGEVMSPQTEYIVNASQIIPVSGDTYNMTVYTWNVTPATPNLESCVLGFILSRDSEDALDTYNGDMYVNSIKLMYLSDRLGSDNP